MTHFTLEQISAAKQNDLEAVTAVIAETEGLIVKRAADYAKRDGRIDRHLADDLAQAGRIRVWESLAQFEGETPQQFMSYIDKALHSAMSEARHKACRPEITEAASKDFESALVLAAGDPFKAARVAVSDQMGRRRMSPNQAYAALLSWLGTDSLSRPINEGDFDEESTLEDVIACQSGTPVDLLEPRDYENAKRKTVREQVHRTLGLLSERQRHVLKADHGIAPCLDYGQHGSDAELSEDMGVTPKQVHEARSRGRKRFAELYQAGARAW